MLIISPLIRTVAKIASLVVYVLTIFSAYGGWFNPHIFTFPAIMSLAFPYLAILSALIAVSWLISGRIFIGATGIAMLLACWVPLSMAVPMKFGQKAEPGEKTFTLLSWNSLHLYDQNDPDHDMSRSIEFLLNCDADIIACQELFSTDLNPKLLKDAAPLLDSLYQKYPYRVMGPGCDQSIFSKYPVERIFLHIDQPIHKQCYSFYRFNIGGDMLTLANVHLISFTLSDEERRIITGLRSSARKSIEEFKGPLKGKMGFAFAERAESAEEVCQALQNIKGPLIVCGDFNDVPASWTYRIFISNGFQDAYAQTCFGPIHTYNAHMMYFHLDQILYRGNLKPLKVKRKSIDTSDHYPVMASFAFTTSGPVSSD